MLDIPRLVQLAAIRHRSQIGRVCLDEQAVERNAPRDLLHDQCVLEGDDTRKGNVKTKVKRGFRYLPAFRETMEYAADLPGPLLCHHAQGVGGCVAVVNDEWLAGFDRCANMNAKALTLPFGCILVPVVVKASLADSNDLRMLRQCDQIGDRWFANIGRFRVHADRGEYCSVRIHKRLNTREFFQRDADTHGTPHVIVVHESEHLRKIVREVGEVYMAVRVNEHRRQFRKRTTGGLHRVRRPRRLHDAAEQTFDLAPRFDTAFIILEMHADTLCLAVLRTGRRNPDDGAGDR